MLRRPSTSAARLATCYHCRCVSSAAAARPATPSSSATRTSAGGGGSSSGARGVARVRSGPRGDSSAGAWNPRVLSQGLDQFVVGQEVAKKVLAVSVYNHYTRLRHIAATAPPPVAAPQEVDLYSSSFGPDASTTLRPIARSSDKDPSPHTSHRRERTTKQWRDMHEDGILTLLPRTFDPSYTTSTAPSTTNEGARAPLLFDGTLTVLDDPTSVSAPLDPTTYNSPVHLSTPKRPRSTSPRPTSTHPTESTAAAHTTSHPPHIGSTLPSTSGVGSLGDKTRHALMDDEALVYEKSNVLLLGPTGSGKSLLARTLAKFLDVPFVAAEATGMTSAGYVGEDVENCVHRLLVAADWDAEAASTGIIFIDEVDKLARSSSSSMSKDVGGEAVQQALLKILEGTVVSVPDKEGSKGRRGGPPKEHHFVDTTNILFILSGAFVGLEKIVSTRLTRTQGSIGFTAQLSPSSSTSSTTPILPPSEVPVLLESVEPADLVRFGFIPEFVGRIPVVAALSALSETDLLRVLTEPKNALVKQYSELLKSSGVTCRFTTAALREVAKSAVGKGTGARGLRSIMERLLLDTMYLAPESSIRYVLIDAAVARGDVPAHDYSLGQSSVFEGDFSAEEDLEVGPTSSSSSSEPERGNSHEMEGKRANG